MSLELHPAAIYDKSNKNKNVNECDQKDFVAFDLDSVPERRPFLLSRDFVFVRPLGSTAEPFQVNLNFSTQAMPILTNDEVPYEYST